MKCKQFYSAIVYSHIIVKFICFVQFENKLYMLKFISDVSPFIMFIKLR